MFAGKTGSFVQWHDFLVAVARWLFSNWALNAFFKQMTAVGFEPTPLRNGALSHRLRPLGQTVLMARETRCPMDGGKVNTDGENKRKDDWRFLPKDTACNLHATSRARSKTYTAFGCHEEFEQGGRHNWTHWGLSPGPPAC